MTFQIQLIYTCCYRPKTTKKRIIRKYFDVIVAMTTSTTASSLHLPNMSSIGFNSGDYTLRYISFDPAASINSFT